MAYAFARASSQYMYLNSTPVTVVPISMACWFKTTNLTDIQTLMSITDYDGGDTNDFVILNVFGDTAGDPVGASMLGNLDQSTAKTTSGITSGKWHHACGVFATVSSVTAYLDGGNATTSNTNTSVLTGIDSVAIGDLYRTADSFTRFADATIAEAAIWNVALSAADAAILAKGYSPLLVRPNSLVAYWPLIRNSTDIVGGYTLTSVNTPTVADHSPVRYASKTIVMASGSSSGPGPGPSPTTAVPPIAMNYFGRRGILG